MIAGLMVGLAQRSVATLGVAVLCAAAGAAERQPAPPPEPAPAVRIAVAPLGYMPPGAFYLTYRLSSASLGFFDDDHLLFTFRVGGLLRRLPSDREDDEDQQIRAVVLDLKTGQVVGQKEWREHDRMQYLWHYPDGKFLVRIRNTLFLTDRSLEFEPYLTFDQPLRAVDVTPDRRMTVVETQMPTPPHPTLGDTESLGSQPVKVEIVPSGSNRAIAVSQASNPTLVPLMSDGLLDILEGRQLGSWVVRDVLFDGKPRMLTEVRSSCQPSVQPVSATVALVGGCYQGADERPIVAVSMTTGKQLWQDRWQTRFVWGWFDYAENGSRFAYESIAIDHPISALNALSTQDIRAQLVGVYDTNTGKLVLVRDATPILTAGQNVALSPDGRRFAVLRNGAIEVYDLPPVEQAAPPTTARAESAKK